MKTVLIYSGGLDSTALMYKLKSEGHQVVALGINYGQRHKKELAAAAHLAHDIGVPFRIADLSGITHLLAGSSQTSPDIEVPEGHYAEESMKKTVVPNRNMIMLAVGIGHAVSIKAQAVAYGAHAGDHAIYPDCREEFASAMATAALLCDWAQIKMLRPFIDMTKTQIATLAHQLGVPIARTWSCYKGGDLHCGKCGTCTERIEALAGSGFGDPTAYRPAAGQAGEIYRIV